MQWIKISTNILHNRKIAALRYEKNGNQIILLWFYLLIIAGQINDDGKVYFTDNIPYDNAKLSREFAIRRDIVDSGIEYFTTNNMITLDKKDFINITGWREYQSFERLEKIKADNRERQKKHYDTHKMSNKNLTKPNTNLTEKNALGITNRSRARESLKSLSLKNRIEKNRIEENALGIDTLIEEFEKQKQEKKKEGE